MQGAYVRHYLLKQTSRCTKKELTWNCWYIQNPLEIKGVRIVYFPSIQSQLLTRYPPFLCLNAHYERKFIYCTPILRIGPQKSPTASFSKSKHYSC